MKTRAEIEQDIWEKGSLNREHVLAFVSLLPDNDAANLRVAVKQWLGKLNDDPRLTKIFFIPETTTNQFGVHQNPADRILADLDNYGRIQHETIIGAEGGPMPKHEMGRKG